MRPIGTFAIVVASLAGGAGGGLLAAWLAGPSGAPLAGGDVAALKLTIARLEARLETLDASLADPATPLPVAAREIAPPPTRLPTIEVAPRPGTAAGGDGTLDPRRLLAEWVASFEGGGPGSEFFRMAVAAYAWPLRVELQEIVADRHAPDELRLQAIAMLDGGSFRGDGATIDTLVGLLRDGGFEAGQLAALGILQRIGDRRTAELIEAISVGLQPLSVRAASWDAIVALCGSAAEPVLLRLLERERDPEAQQQLLARFTGADPAATLRAFEITSRFPDRDPRLAAAGAIGSQRSPGFHELTQEWHDRERDDDVRARLEAALGEQQSIPAYHPLRATGEADVADRSADDGRAWAPATADGGREWLELTYGDGLRADRVTIHQTCSAGAIVEVAIEADGRWETVWSGVSPTTRGPFHVDFAATGAPVTRVRVVLDTKLQSGWNEIDAVALSGPGGRAFATGAAASSWYGAGRGRNFGAQRLDASALLFDQFNQSVQSIRRGE